MSKKLVSLLVTLLATVGIGLATATPAEAVASCSSTAICGYDNPNNLPLWGFSETITRNVCHAVTPNRTRYIDNNTPVQWRVYTGPGCTGVVGIIYANSEGWMGGVYDNNIESLYRTSSL